MNFERLGEYKYRIPREGKMEVDAAFYASEKILEDLEAENYASLRQLANVATLPGIMEPALTMPDIHWGDRKSTRLNSSHANISYAAFCLKKNHTPVLLCAGHAAVLAALILLVPWDYHMSEFYCRPYLHGILLRAAIDT